MILNFRKPLIIVAIVVAGTAALTENPVLNGQPNLDWNLIALKKVEASTLAGAEDKCYAVTSICYFFGCYTVNQCADPCYPRSVDEHGTKGSC
jgi:hypothetical protein